MDRKENSGRYGNVESSIQGQGGNMRHEIEGYGDDGSESPSEEFTVLQEDDDDDEDDSDYEGEGTLEVVQNFRTS